MCNFLYLSTDFPEKPSFKDHRFEAVEPKEPAAIRKILAYPNLWYLPCRYGGCSCHFRHAMEPELGFGEPEDWYPEDEDDVEATADLHDFLANLVQRGYQVDMVDLWDGQWDLAGEMTISLTQIPRRHLRFFEGYRFDFVS